MSVTKENNAVLAGSVVGWCVAAAGLAQVPGIVAGILTARMLPQAGLVLLLFTLPSGLLLFVGGLGLIWRQFAGYYCVYLATFFGGIGGFKFPYIPFLKRFVNIGPATEDLFLALNLLLVAILVWEHWRRLGHLAPSSQKAHRIALIALVVLGIGAVSGGRAMIHRERGEKVAAADLPGVGAGFSEFNTSGKLPYVSVETKIPHGLTLVFSGISDEAAIQALARTHHLKKMDAPEAHKKFLPQVKAWKLDETTFRSQFDPDDWYYVGRMKDLPKVNLQIVYGRSDRRFTAQIFGVLPR
jgi:hypothetical protein